MTRPVDRTALADAWQRWLETWWTSAKERQGVARLVGALLYVRGLVDAHDRAAAREAANDA